MPKLTNSLPKCRLHKRSGLAVVTLTGHDFYLGPYGTKASKLEYDRLIGAWLAAIRQKLWGFHVRERDVLRGWLSPSILCGARALRSSRCGLAGVEAHKGAGRTILRLDQPVIVHSLAARFLGYNAFSVVNRDMPERTDGNAILAGSGRWIRGGRRN